MFCYTTILLAIRYKVRVRIRPNSLTEAIDTFVVHRAFLLYPAIEIRYVVRVRVRVH
jgi:hypothetical protein